MLALACALALLLTACNESARPQPPEGAAEIWFAVGTGEDGGPLADGGGAVAPEYRALPDEADPVEERMAALLSGPQSAELRSPFPSGVRLRSWRLEEGVLRLDLSEAYGGLSGVDLTIADYCIVLTLCQVEGVEAVDITVEGETVPYRGRKLMREGDVVLSGGEGEPVTITASLYFLRRSGGLASESREVLVTENDTLATAVMGALMAGPRDQEELYLPLPEGTELLSAAVEAGVCYVNFSRAFTEGAPQSREEAARLLYAVVDTLCSLDQVEAVHLLVEGESLDRYGGVPNRNPLEKDYEMAGEEKPAAASGS